jgi:pyruvate formate lyase activating enzyme
LVLPEKFESPIGEDEVFDFLNSRQKRIEAVVISGGEPTLQDDLVDFSRKIKELGFLLKLDTNGTRPKVLGGLYEEKLLDYVAMDIKHKFDSYEGIINVRCDIEKIKQSIDLIKNSGVDYEFRTTVVPAFHTLDDIKAIILQLSGVKRFIIQEFIPEHAINKDLTSKNSIFTPDDKRLLEIIDFGKLYVKEFQVRSAN